MSIQDNINSAYEFVGIYDELPKVGKDNCVYAVRVKNKNRYKTYIYSSSSSDWIEIGEILTEEKFKLRPEEFKI